MTKNRSYFDERWRWEKPSETTSPQPKSGTNVCQVCHLEYNRALSTCPNCEV